LMFSLKKLYICDLKIKLLPVLALVFFQFCHSK
jgi:hypothetical protein